MRDQRWEPFAPVLLESMRAVGYSPEAAIADLVDNCLSADATKIDIIFPPGQPDYVAILDNGHGMDEKALLAAMRHGSRNPNEARAESDLGRFGLGLKTASLSQARRLEVVSVVNGRACGCAWDLDHIAKTQDWTLQIMDAADIAAVPCSERLLEETCGTLVVLRNLDRLAAGDLGDGAVLSEKMSVVRQHLGLVFHRFLNGGEGLPKVNINVNDAELADIDPFLSAFRSTQKGQIEKIRIEGVDIRVQAFTLPHISRLTRDEIETAGGAEGLRRQQGFYVYRNRRLIVWGTWFRMFRQEELTKLTRVRVDVPNALDHLWALDIKKSAASPPEIVRLRLRQLVPRMVQEGRVVQLYRGKLQTDGKLVPLWRRVELRDGSIHYQISEDHPAIAALRDELDDNQSRQLRIVLRAIQESFPGEAYYNDKTQERIGFKEADSGDRMAFLEDLARQIASGFSANPEYKKRFISTLTNIQPFSDYPEMAKAIQGKLQYE